MQMDRPQAGLSGVAASSVSSTAMVGMGSPGDGMASVEQIGGLYVEWDIQLR